MSFVNVTGWWCAGDLRQSPRGRNSLPHAHQHGASKLSTPVTADVDDDDDDDDSEVNVYQPNLHLDDVDMLLDPTTAPAAYRKAISGLFECILYSAMITDF